MLLSKLLISLEKLSTSALSLKYELKFSDQYLVIPLNQSMNLTSLYQTEGIIAHW